MLGGSGDAQPDPKPFWKAVMQFDANVDKKLERKEMTKGFTWPLRPELPVGHPGFGLPIPKRDGPERKRRLAAVLQEDLNAENGASPLANCLITLARSLVSSLAEKREVLAFAEMRQLGYLV